MSANFGGHNHANVVHSHAHDMHGEVADATDHSHMDQPTRTDMSVEADDHSLLSAQTIGRSPYKFTGMALKKVFQAKPEPPEVINTRGFAHVLDDGDHTHQQPASASNDPSTQFTSYSAEQIETMLYSQLYEVIQQHRTVRIVIFVSACTLTSVCLMYFLSLASMSICNILVCFLTICMSKCQHRIHIIFFPFLAGYTDALDRNQRN